MIAAALCALLSAPVGAQGSPELAAPPPPRPAGRAGAAGESPARMKTPRGELLWSLDEKEVAVLSRDGRRLRTIPLARDSRKPPEDIGLRALLPASGEHFLVVEESRQEVGLHLAERRAVKKPKATVVRSVLRLVHESGRVLWERPTEDKTLVGRRSDPQHLQIGPDGTVAILLEDVDPYSRSRPLLSVIDPKGRETLRLDYTAWTRVDEFALSADGASLAVHGFGLVPEEGEMSRAIALYALGKGSAWVRALERRSRTALRLHAVGVNGWTCCVQTPGGWTAFDRDGQARRLSPEEMTRLFGVRP